MAELNRKLTNIVDYIAERAEVHVAVGFDDIEAKFNITLEFNDVLLDTVLNMLGERPEIQAVEIDKNEFIIYSNREIEQPAEDLSDPSVTKEDMYAHGYGYENMIPLGRDRALELFDKGHEIYRLYVRGFELPVNGRNDIEVFDGMFGVIDPAFGKDARPQSIEAFIVNRAGYGAAPHQAERGGVHRAQLATRWKLRFSPFCAL